MRISDWSSDVCSSDLMADPDARVICVSGDGGFQMNIQELATMARERLPVKIVLIDNQALGMVRQWQELFFSERRSEEHTSELQSLMRISYAVFCLKKKQHNPETHST